MDVSDGMDDVALAFAVDAWTRTGRVSVDASARGPVKLRSGLTLLAKPSAKDTRRACRWRRGSSRCSSSTARLSEIAERFGAERREWVMMELEHPGS